MADRVLLMSWGTVVRGREEHALEVFNAAVGMYGRMQQDGRIESFDVTLLSPHGGMGGYIQVHGTADQIARLREDEEFMRATIDASLIVDDLRLVDGRTGAAVARQMELYQAGIAKVAQHV